MKQLYVKIQHRSNESETWKRINPILAEGEIGIESNTRKFKYGDGKTNWNNLEYAFGSGLTSIIAENVEELKTKYLPENYPGAIAIVPREYETEEETFIMDTPYISLRKSGKWYWTVFADQKDAPLVTNLLDAFVLDVSPLG